MTIYDIMFIAVGLSMDAFAVSLSKGMMMKRGIDFSLSCIMALFFGGFQAIMPLIGWILGNRFNKYIVSYDHWIVFFLLGFVGIKMIYDCFVSKEESCGDNSWAEITALSFATSLDALSVGISFSFLPIDILAASSVIGACAFCFTLFGIIFGRVCGKRLGLHAGLAGGIILFIIGIKILFEHLGFI